MQLQLVKRYTVFIGIFVSLSLFPFSIFAADFYVAQSQAGSGDGSSCNNAYVYSWFNNANNWATPKVQGKIGPGDTVHLCGTISNQLYIYGGGTSESPLTIKWEEGAKLSRPSGTLLSLMNNGPSLPKYLVFDGGLNGVIENTDNGDALTYQNVVDGVTGANISNVEFKNLTFRNLYVKSGSEPTPVTYGRSGAVAIYFNGFGDNISIHNSTFHDMSWALAIYGSTGAINFNFYNNILYDYDHGVAGLDGLTSGNIYNNHFGTTAKWDTTTNQWHHDGIHVFFNGSGGKTVTGLNIYNNLFDGDWGSNNTAHIFFECDYTNTNQNACTKFNIYNNVFIEYPGRLLNNGFINGRIGSGFSFYNNTFLGGGSSNSTAIMGIGPGTTFKNNLISSVTTFIWLSNTNWSFVPNGLNNNIYANQIPGGNPAFRGTGISSFADWQKITQQDADSSQVADGNLLADAALKPNSPAIASGVNLSSLKITPLNSDKAGNPRPQTSDSPWDIGAYNYIGKLAAPSNLRVGN